MLLQTPRLLLREFRAGDFAHVREYETDPEVQRYERPVPADVEIREYLRKAEMWASEQPRTHYLFAVTLPPADCARGRLSLTLLNTHIREWEIGWTIHRRHWGQGYATEAANRVIRLAFEELGAHRVVAFCHVANAASVRVMEKVGMQQEGCLRQVRWWNGGWSDEYVYALLDRDWMVR